MVISPSWRRYGYERLLKCLASHRLVLVVSPRRHADCAHPNHHGKFSFLLSQRFPRWSATPFARSLFVTTCGARPRPLLELLLRFVHPLIWMLFALPLDRFVLVLLCRHSVCAYVRLAHAVLAEAAAPEEALTRGTCPCRAPTVSLAGTCMHHLAFGRFPMPRCALGAHLFTHGWPALCLASAGPFLAMMRTSWPPICMAGQAFGLLASTLSWLDMCLPLQTWCGSHLGVQVTHSGPIF
ncbi:hypothetical protein V6N13_124083 [Hibiscus sabdariffa]